MRRKLLDANDPFFAAPWRRWATCILPTAWGLFELATQSPLWGVLFVGAGGYAFYELIVRGPSDT